MVAELLIAAAFAQPVGDWQAGVATSYVWRGTFDGPGVTVQSTWAPTGWFALGPVVDMARLSSGPLAAPNGFPASFSFTSTIAAGLFEFRWPMPYVEPYGDVALGYVAVSQQRSQNTQCGFGSGIGGFLAAGARAALGDHVTAGVRGSVRSPSLDEACAAVHGPAGLDPVNVLFTAGGTLELRW